MYEHFFFFGTAYFFDRQNPSKKTWKISEIKMKTLNIPTVYKKKK